MRHIDGTQGYSEQANALREQYDRASFENVHAPVIHLVPKQAASVLDIGAGTGRDASYLSEMGHETVAVEPTDEFRIPAAAKYPDIEWVDDALPELAKLRESVERFDLIMATAVWMHLSDKERKPAMHNVGRLIKPNGLFMISLRHGAVPEGRLMFDVSAAETVALAKSEGFRILIEAATPSIGEVNKKAGVFWTHLAFQKLL